MGSLLTESHPFIGPFQSKNDRCLYLFPWILKLQFNFCFAQIHSKMCSMFDSQQFESESKRINGVSLILYFVTEKNYILAGILLKYWNYAKMKTNLSEIIVFQMFLSINCISIPSHRKCSTIQPPNFHHQNPLKCSNIIQTHSLKVLNCRYRCMPVYEWDYHVRDGLVISQTLSGAVTLFDCWFFKFVEI